MSTSKFFRLEIAFVLQARAFLLAFQNLLVLSYSKLHLKSCNYLWCSSDISEPKYTHNSRQPTTRLRVCIYPHTRIQYTRVYLISMYELTVSSFLNGHCCFQWLESLPQGERKNFL